jgi:hypothetical protein
MSKTFHPRFLFPIVIFFLITGCLSVHPISITRYSTAVNTFAPTLELTPPFAPLQTETPVFTAIATPTLEPVGCQRPPDDYTHIEVNGWILNQRTYAMLQHTAELYTGKIDIANTAITQGSYHDNGSASFGTHLGGGAVDLSVIELPSWKVMYDEIEPLIHALRVAGFAAWLRDFDEVYDGSPIHIHAIAIGDAELSRPAIDQLTGPNGYFRGFTGFPWKQEPDRHGGPILCQWMIDMGYGDWRNK